MGQEFILFNNNNLQTFFEILSKTVIQGLITHFIDIKTFRTFLTKLNIKKECSFILSEDNENVGIFLSNFSKESANIIAVAVLENYQGLGYGKILLQKGLSLLQEYNINTVNLEVAETNISAINLYKSEGFSISKEIINFRNENTSFFLNDDYYKKKYLITKNDPLMFQLIYKSFQNDTLKPALKNLNYLLAKLENNESELFTVTSETKKTGYMVISRKVNTLQIEDIRLPDYDNKLLSFFLTGIVKNEKIVQANNFYSTDKICSQFLQNGFFVDLKQIEMKKELK